MPPADAEPRRIGPDGQYEVIEVVGQGAFGTVLKARDHLLNRFVALKAYLQPEAYQRELAALQKLLPRLQNPPKSLIHIHHLFLETSAKLAFLGESLPSSTADIPVLAMEWVDGRHFDEVAAEFRNREPEFFDWVANQMLEALAVFRNANGLRHGDLHPGNILIAGRDRVVLVDYGLVASQTRTCIARSDYRAPEELTDAVPCDEPVTADLYALGLVLYEQLAGTKPPPEERTRVFQPDLSQLKCSDQLKSLLADLLAFRPQDRLRAFPPRPVDAPPPERKPRWLYFAAAAVFAALLLAGVAGFNAWRNAHLPNSTGPSDPAPTIDAERRFRDGSTAPRTRGAEAGTGATVDLRQQFPHFRETSNSRNHP